MAEDRKIENRSVGHVMMRTYFVKRGDAYYIVVVVVVKLVGVA